MGVYARGLLLLLPCDSAFFGVRVWFGKVRVVDAKYFFLCRKCLKTVKAMRGFSLVVPKQQLSCFLLPQKYRWGRHKNKSVNLWRLY